MDILIEVPLIGLNIIFDSQEQVLQSIMLPHLHLYITYPGHCFIPLSVTEYRALWSRSG